VQGVAVGGEATAWLVARRAEIQLNVWAPEVVERSVAKKSMPSAG